MQATLSSSIFAVLALAAIPANAAIVITTASNGLSAGASTTDELAYASFVSTTDLLTGILGTSPANSWNATPEGLNDGAHGGDSTVNVTLALSGAAWAKNLSNVSSRDFFLGTGVNGLGFDITEIQSIAAWQGAGFQNQRYEVLVSTVGSPLFTLLTTVDFQPSTSVLATDNQGGSTMVNVTDTNGILASGIDAVRFNILDTVGNAAGGTVFREIDVFGAATVPEPSAFALTGLGALVLLRRRRQN